MMLLFLVLTWMGSLAPDRQHIELATAVAQVASESPPLFRDDDDRMKTAALMTAIAFRESTLTNSAIGDHGRARCAFQLWNAPEEVLVNPVMCARIGLERLRESIRICGAGNELGIYAVGPKGCSSETAKRISRDRMAIAKRLAREASR